MNQKSGGGIGVIVTVVVVVILLFGMMGSCSSGGSSSSSYQLHNKDGSLNQDYVNDMNDYFEKHPEKLPK